MEIVTSVMIRLKSMQEKKEMVTQELQVVQVEWDGSTRKMCEQEGNELNFNLYAKKKPQILENGNPNISSVKYTSVQLRWNIIAGCSPRPRLAGWEEGASGHGGTWQHHTCESL